MTVFLTVVDRTAAGSNTTFASATRLQNLLVETSGNYQRFVGPDYEVTPVITPVTKRYDVKVLYWRRKGEEAPLCSNEREWSLSSGHQVASSLLERIRPRGGTLSYSAPVWGHYAAVWGLHEVAQVYAWNTVPALESIHWSATSEYVVISNRPILVSMYLAAIAGRRDPELSADYLPEYLYYGYSITGQTPFRGVRTLSVNSALAVRNGDISIEPRPTGLRCGLSGNHSDEEGAEALAEALTGAMDRTEQQISGRPLQLRLSGGKDSRLLLALLRHRNIDYRAVTFGQKNDVDVQLASYLCEMVGIGGEVRAPRPADGETIAERITSTLRESGGMPASEPHTAQYQGADPERPHEAIMLGQWPLYKGGMARHIRPSSNRILQRLKDQGGALVNAATREVFDTHLLSWSDQLTLANENEKLYLFAREFRSGRYLHAHIDQYSAASMIAYPIADAEVTAVCDALTMEEKVSERALFGALSKIWPEVMKVPLDRSHWRFEADGRDSALSGPWYEDRNGPVPAQTPQKITQVKKVVSEYSEAAAIEMAEHLSESRCFDQIAMYLDEQMLRSLASLSNGHLIVPQGMSQRLFIKFVWRLVVAERWLAMKWLR